MDVILDPTRTAGPAPALRGVYLGDSPEPFVEEDVERLRREVGVTCIRYGVEAATLADEEREEYHDAGFQAVRRVLDWCSAYDVRCVLDVHNALGRRFGGDPRLWREPAFQDRFVRLWERIVAEFRDHPAVVAWELLNEPEPPEQDFAVWNTLYQRTVEAVRRLDPERAIVVDSIGYAKPQAFTGLAASDDRNVVYSFHNYQPGPYHCQKRRELRDQSTYYYPGFVPHKRPDGDPRDFSLAHYEPSEGKFWNRRQLEEEWAPALAFRDEHDVPLFCGEFGCVSDVPPMTDMVYLMDEIGLLQEHGIHWTLYNTMYRTDDPYWKDHFDCGLYIWYSPEQRLHRFGRKIALMEVFCRTEGTVLTLEEPEDEWVGLYGIRRPDHSLLLLVANKGREEAKEINLTGRWMPTRYPAALKTMGPGDDGWSAPRPLVFEECMATLHLAPLTLACITIQAPGGVLWKERPGR